MPFKKGHSGAKPKGSVSKTTAKAKDLILASIDSQSVYFDSTMAIIRQTNPNDWAKIMVKLMDFVIPKKLDIMSGGEKLGTPVNTWANDSTKPKV